MIRYKFIVHLCFIFDQKNQKNRVLNLCYLHLTELKKGNSTGI